VEDDTELWLPHLETRAGDAQTLKFDLRYLPDGTIPLDPTDTVFPAACARACGVVASVPLSWRLREFASPFYGQEPLSSRQFERVGRAWEIAIDLPSDADTTGLAAHGPEPRRLSLPEDARFVSEENLLPYSELPAIAIALSRSQLTTDLLTTSLPRSVPTPILTDHGEYTEIRVDSETELDSAWEWLDGFCRLAESLGAVISQHRL
jgi:hypothetical protein